MNINKKLVKEYIKNANNTKEEDLVFYYLWNAFVKKIENEKAENTSLRQGIRDYIEASSDDFEIDFEDERLDVFYLSPIFNDLRVEEDKDTYYYEYYNTSKQTRFNDDYLLSIKNFQRIIQDNDLSSMMMSVFKVYDYVMSLDNDDYDERVKELIAAANYLLKIVLFI